MKNPKADLEAIMDLLVEWKKENGIGYVIVSVYEDGVGYARDVDNDGHSRYEVFKKCLKTDNAGGDLDGKEQSS